MNFSSVKVRKDAYAPKIIIHAPIDNVEFGSTAPNFNVSIIESDLAFMWYVFEGDTTQYPFSDQLGSINQEAWTNLTEGEIQITFYAQDKAGNIGSKSVKIIKNLPSTSIPGFSWIVILSIVGVMCVWVKTKKDYEVK